MQAHNQLPFETGEHDWLQIHSRMLTGVDTALFNRKASLLRKRANRNVRPIPEVMTGTSYETVKRGAIQRAKAARLFCKDVYSTSQPEVLNAIPGLRTVMQTNSHFFSELAGQYVMREVHWDFVMAFDWLYEIENGSPMVRTIESDSGGVAGIFHLAFLFSAMKEILPRRPLQNCVREGSKYLSALFYRLNRRMKIGRKNATVLFTENDFLPLIEDRTDTFVQNLIKHHGVSICSSHNREALSFGSDHILRFDGKRVGACWMRFYSTALDPVFDKWNGTAALYNSHAIKAHQIPHFWSHFLNSGESHCYVNNPIGSEMFVDKATSRFLGELIRFYLCEKPILPDQECIIPLVDGDEIEKIDPVAEKDLWVIKPRFSMGHGSGVIIGKLNSLGTWMKHWKDMLAEKEKFVVQRLYTPARFRELGGSGDSYPEFRIVTYGLGDSVYNADGVLVRASDTAVSKRGLTGSKENFIVPIFIGKREKLDTDQTVMPWKCSVDEILNRLRNGYYPYWDSETQQFVWDRDEHIRAIIRLNQRNVEKAHRVLARYAKTFTATTSCEIEQALCCLCDPIIKPKSWVSEEVATVYRSLQNAGFMRSIRALQGDLTVGGLIGVELKNVFLAETMFWIRDNSSKICVAELIVRQHERGAAIIDVQVPHPSDHIVYQLGEEIVDLEEYLSILRKNV